MKRKIVHDISASSLQVIINQICAVLIFYLLSKYFTKNNFGDINWSLAVLMMVFPILGCGIDQLTVKKIAAGNEVPAVIKLYLFHVIFTGLLFASVLVVTKVVAGTYLPRLNILIFLAIGQLFIFVSSPFKQIANGKEQFRLLLLMSTGANITRVLGLLVFGLLGWVNITYFILIYIVSSAAELVACLYLIQTLHVGHIGISVSLKKYLALIKEALPQLGVIVCNAGIARIDWILLGILSTSSVLANYSFAYKAFEFSTLPLLVVAPLLLPKITRWFQEFHQEHLYQKKKYLLVLARLEIALASWGILVLNICWSPVIDRITDNKYGAVNHYNILILSCSVPFLYVNNILWAVNFAIGKMKLILCVFVVTFLLTCAGNLLLIPHFHAEGSAIAYLTAIVVETLYFIVSTQLDNLHKVVYYLLLCIGSALISGWLSSLFSDSVWFQLGMATAVYFLIVSATRQIRVGDWVVLRNVLQT
jgi:O-antigen/teichoic acid export membrane protein